LLAQCRIGQARGMNFPALWRDILRPSPLVIGPPVQAVRNGQIRLEVQLISGERIAFDTASHQILPD
jgi:hypothetical protein